MPETPDNRVVAPDCIAALTNIYYEQDCDSQHHKPNCKDEYARQEADGPHYAFGVHFHNDASGFRLFK